MYDLIIIGGGPAGISASVYAARKKLNTLIIASEIGGQSVVSAGIENWIGTPTISGFNLAKNFEKHIRLYENKCLDIKKETVTEIKDENDFITIKTNNDLYKTKTLMYCAGSSRRKIQAQGAEEFEHKGITYCATCDGPVFADMDIAVVGGGNAGFETALQLAEYTKSVTLLNRSASYNADQITVKKALENKKIVGILNAEITEFFGDGLLEGLKYNDNTKKEHILKINGAFIEIGLIPETNLIKNLVETNQMGKIITDPKTQKTSNSRIWSAGDCTDGLYHQNNIASGDAVKALENLFISIKKEEV